MEKPHDAYRWVILVLAILFGLSALRGVETGGIVSTDSARHATNGALIHDWLREGPWLAPGDYARWYYARWPALSLGYHPPVFPAIEALVFFAVGVGAFGARLVVALATGISVLLLYRLVLTTHQNPSMAVLSAAAFFSLPLTQKLSQQVMLEMPALVFILAALLALPPRDEPFTPRRGVAFALFAALAIWTKQLSVFVAAVPVLTAVLYGRRDWLRSRVLWSSVALVAVAFLALTVFELAFGPASPRRFAIFRGMPRVLAANAQMYFDTLVSRPTLAVVTSLVVVAGLAGLRRTHWRAVSRADGLYWAWLVSAMAALMVGKWNSTRYLFFACPALATLAVATAHRLLGRRGASARPTVAVLGAAAGLFAFAITNAPPVLIGPAEAARVVAADGPIRVLYAGESDGHFTFELRSATRNTDAVVIRGEKLPDATYSPATFEEFASRYGVTHVVLEEIGRFGRMPWTSLIATPSPSMQSLGQLPVSGSSRGVLHLYRFTARAADTLDVIMVPSEKIGVRMLELNWKAPSWRRSEGITP